jgi:fucose permease
MFVLGMSDNIRGPLYPELLRDFGLSNSQGSFTFAIASFAAMLGNASSAWFIKKINLGQLLSFSMFCMMLGLFFMGVSPGFYAYLSAAFVFGFSMGTVGVAQNLLVAENIIHEKQTRAFSALHSFYGFSSLLAPLLASRTPLWFSRNFGQLPHLSTWQSGFFVISALALFIFISLLLIKPEPRLAAHHEVEITEAGTKSPWNVMLWFAGFFSFYVMAEILVSSRLALYMRTYFAMDFEQSSNYVTYFFICLLIGRLVFVLKHFNMALRKQLNLSLFLAAVTLGLGLSVHPLFLALTGLMMGPYYPLSVVYISQMTGAQKRRFLTFTLSLQSLAVIAMHVGVGFVTDLWGLLPAYSLGIVFLICALFCLNFHPVVRTEEVKS